MSSFAVLVASSDERKDIFDVCFANSERIWKDCDWPRYVGFNSPWPPQYGFITLTATSGEWRQLVAQYLDQLPVEIRYVLLMVEDTLFAAPINAEALKGHAYYARSAGMDYLRLVPQRKSLPAKLASALMPPSQQKYERIRDSDPYYSSTEMALWARDYLRGLLDVKANAWEFECLNSGKPHWAIIEPFLDQNQIVQKGRWNRDAPRYLAKAGLPPPPPSRHYQSLSARLRGHWQNINFALFGFTSVRIKQWLKFS